MRSIRIGGLLAALLTPALAGAEFTLDDITYWVGEGENRAALAIDWEGAGDTDQALVWGYRWDGDATGADLLRDVITNDPRLFAKLGENVFAGVNGLSVFGLGYDFNGDDEFAINDGTTFGANGVFPSNPADGAVSSDPEDHYREGWEDAFWHYGLSGPNDGGPNWFSSAVGPSDRPLVDGGWDGYAIAVTLNSDEFAQNLVAAPAPREAGDSNRDGVVNLADYTVWRDAFGASVDVPGQDADADFSGVTDLGDYDAWRDAISAVGPAITIPEPTGLTTCLLFSLLCLGTHLRRVS